MLSCGLRRNIGLAAAGPYPFFGSGAASTCSRKRSSEDQWNETGAGNQTARDDARDRPDGTGRSAMVVVGTPFLYQLAQAATTAKGPVRVSGPLPPLRPPREPQLARNAAAPQRTVRPHRERDVAQRNGVSLDGAVGP